MTWEELKKLGVLTFDDVKGKVEAMIVLDGDYTTNCNRLKKYSPSVDSDLYYVESGVLEIENVLGELK